MIEYLKVGKIVSTQGLKGEVRVYTFADDIKRFDDLKEFYLEKKEKFEVERVRYKGNMVIMKIKGIDVIEDTQRLMNKFMYVSRENSRELDEDEYFISDMIGIKAYTVSGEYIGVLDDVLQYSANDVYVIKNDEGKEFLIPALYKFVPTIDMNERKMIIDPIKGMID